MGKIIHSGIICNNEIKETTQMFLSKGLVK